MGCTNSVSYLVYIALLKANYILCVKKTKEQIYRNMYLLIHKLIVMAFLSVQNILLYI